MEACSVTLLVLILTTKLDKNKLAKNLKNLHKNIVQLTTTLTEKCANKMLQASWTTISEYDKMLRINQVSLISFFSISSQLAVLDW